MKRFALAAFVCLAAATFVRADDWSKSYSISGKADLRITTSDANIKVDTWDQNTIEAHVVADNYKIGDSVKIDERQSGDSVAIDVRFPFRVMSFRIHHRVDIEIHMPREGRLNLHTGDGAIRLANFRGDMQLETGDGRVEIDSVDGTLNAKSGDGHITVVGRFDSLNVTTGDGHIDARALAGSTMASSWTLHTGDGSVRLGLPETFSAELDLHTSDGHIDVGVPLTVQGRLGQKNIHGKLNNGGALLTVHTGDGSIHLEKL
ncbi:MAG TPA: DUF4097 family beta strand repeat-containing protein [Blastocatellia bacterium]|nr:DUF4097 family beta strand repeat-containing protein [Blastocatellia bacterium]